MQGIPVSLSSLATSIKPVIRNPMAKLYHSSSSPPAHVFHSFSGLSRLELLHLPPYSRANEKKSASSLIFSPKKITFKVGASSVPEAKSDEPIKPSALIRNLRLAAMFGSCYLLNIYFNIYNKQVLKVYPFPATVTAFHFGFTALMMNLIWALNFYPRPNVTSSQLAAILPLAVAHTLGNLLTNISIGKVAVSFTHTIKALEPLFTVVLSSLFLGELLDGPIGGLYNLIQRLTFYHGPTFWVVSSLIPIISGVALASMTEVSFNWIGFYSAMASNLTNQSRNVLSKKFMVNEEESLDNINLFSVITIISFILLAPFAIFVEGFKFSPSYLQYAASEGLNVKELCVRLILAGFCFHAYQQVSYGILQLVSPVTHSVGNCVKRVVVIVSSVIFFQTPVSIINTFGTAVALAGVYLYSRAKQIKP